MVLLTVLAKERVRFYRDEFKSWDFVVYDSQVLRVLDRFDCKLPSNATKKRPRMIAVYGQLLGEVDE